MEGEEDRVRKTGTVSIDHILIRRRPTSESVEYHGFSTGMEVGDIFLPPDSITSGCWSRQERLRSREEDVERDPELVKRIFTWAAEDEQVTRVSGESRVG